MMSYLCFFFCNFLFALVCASRVWLGEMGGGSITEMDENSRRRLVLR